VASQEPGTPPDVLALEARTARLRRFYGRLVAAGKEASYEAAHARLAIRYLATCQKRMRLLGDGKLNRLPDESQQAADRSYFATAMKLCEGMEKLLEGYAKSPEASHGEMYQLWNASK
jgi:hypothetical protein